MIKILKEIFQLLSLKQKISLLYLQLSIIFSSLAELFSIFVIFLFIKIGYNFDFVIKNHYLNLIFENYLDSNKYSFVLYLGIIVLIVTFLSIIFSLFTQWFLIRFTEKAHQDISNIIYFKFINQVWKSNFSGTYAEFNSLIFSNLTEIKNRIIYSFFQANNKLFILFFFSSAIFFYSKYIFLIGLVILIILYVILFRFIKKIASRNSDKTIKMIDAKAKMLSDSFLGIRDISLLALENKYYERFNFLGEHIIKYVSKNVALSYLPRLLIEYLSYCFIIVLIILIVKLSGHPDEILQTVIFLGFAGLKIIPSLNQIYTSFVNIRIGLPFYNDVKKKFLLDTSKKDHKLLSKITYKKVTQLKIEKSIALNKIYLKYANNLNYSLNDINLKIPIHKVIGITGHSGSGKSSLVDIILGFAKPTKGQVLLDGKTVKY
jgi:HlyD family secretion protein